MKKHLILFFVALLFCVSASAQKYGHMNSGNLLAQMPETARADTVLQMYQKDLMLKGDTLTKQFESEYKAFVEAYNAGTLSAEQTKKRQEYLQKQQQLLQRYAQDVDEKVDILRQQLLQPILDKINDAIQAIGRENGYSMIFDTGNGAALFATESEDVTPMVKKKLGIN